MNKQKEPINDLLVLTPTEVGKLLRISRGKVYESIRLGIIPSIRWGRTIRIPKAALMKMLEGAKGEGSQP